jgi:hypothetical protein
MKTTESVAIVLVQDFGGALGPLARRMPVWVVDSPANRAAVERHEQGLESEVTTFQDAPADSAEALFVEILETVELHHGTFSADPPCEILEVIGVAATERIRTALADIGFAVVVETPQGFHAVRCSA